MTKVTLEIPKSSDAKLLLAFAKRLNAIVLNIDEKKEAKQSAFYWLEELAKMGGIESIDDPVKWQRENRKSRKLPFRD